MNHREAIHTVARHLIDSAVVARYGEMWEMYPDIGEHDWDRVCTYVEDFLNLAVRPSKDRFDTAYEMLSERSDR